MHSPRSCAIAFLVAAALAACANQPPTASGLAMGASQAEARSLWGEPLAVYASKQSSIWFYDTGVRTLQRQRIVFDAQGRVQQQGSAWSRAAFAQVQPGWDSQQVLHHFGPPTRQEAPRSSILQERDDAPQERLRASRPPATAQAKHWLYGFREHTRYYAVVLTVENGRVTAVNIQEDMPQNSF